MRRSRVTGQTRVPGIASLDGTVSMLLYDGARAVPVYDLFGGMASYQDADGRTTIALCYCGPAATLPGRYTEERRPGAVPAHEQYVITENIDGHVYQWSKHVPTHLRNLPVDTVWRMVREDYCHAKQEAGL